MFQRKMHWIGRFKTKRDAIATRKKLKKNTMESIENNKNLAFIKGVAI